MSLVPRTWTCDVIMIANITWYTYWYLRWYHLWYHGQGSMIPITYDIMVCNSDIIISIITDFSIDLIYDINIISWSCIYDIKNLWYHESMISEHKSQTFIMFHAWYHDQCFLSSYHIWYYPTYYDIMYDIINDIIHDIMMFDVRSRLVNVVSNRPLSSLIKTLKDSAWYNTNISWMMSYF